MEVINHIVVNNKKKGRKNMKKLALILALCMVFSLCTISASADEAYPARDVTVIVPWAAGGGSDMVARSISEAAQEITGVNFTCQNQTGAGGAVGFAVGAAAQSDGYTLTLLTTEITMVPHTSAVAFDYSSFRPICQLNAASAVLAVPADAPYDTIEDFVAYAKDHPEEITVANSGTGALWHLAACAFAQAADIQLTHIPYNGASECNAAVLGGHVNASVASAPEFAANLEAGNLKLLVVMADERLEAYPDVPTAKELGYDVSVSTWRGMAVPKNVPEDVAAKLDEIFAKAVESETFKNYMANAGQTIAYLNAEEFASKMEYENDLYKGLLTDLGLSIY